MATTRDANLIESLHDRVNELTTENEDLKAYSEALRKECVALKKELDKRTYAEHSHEDINMLKECVVRMALERYGVR